MGREFNTVHIGGHYEKIQGPVAGVEIKPGMLVETYDDGGVEKVRPHSSATGFRTRKVAIEQLAKGVDVVYPIGDQVNIHDYYSGGQFWGLLPSGQDIAMSEHMQSNGDGLLKQATASTADAGLAYYKSRESTGGAITVETRIWTEVL